MWELIFLIQIKSNIVRSVSLFIEENSFSVLILFKKLVLKIVL
jgi:hypothetical protein